MKQQEEEKLKKIQNGEEVVDGVEKGECVILLPLTHFGLMPLEGHKVPITITRGHSHCW